MDIILFMFLQGTFQCVAVVQFLKSTPWAKVQQPFICMTCLASTHWKAHLKSIQIVLTSVLIKLNICFNGSCISFKGIPKAEPTSKAFYLCSSLCLQMQPQEHNQHALKCTETLPISEFPYLASTCLLSLKQLEEQPLPKDIWDTYKESVSRQSTHPQPPFQTWVWITIK